MSPPENQADHADLQRVIEQGWEDREAITHADYLWFTSLYDHRVAWNPALRTYVDTHFVRVRSDVAKFRLYVRKGFPGSNAAK